MAFPTIDNRDQLIFAMAHKRQGITYVKQGWTMAEAGRWVSFWQSMGNPPSGAPPIDAMEVALDIPGVPFFVSDADNCQYLAKISGTASKGGHFVLFDRLTHAGDIRGDDTGSQDHTTSDIGSNRGEPSGREGFLEITEDFLNSGTVGVHVEYKNQNGDSNECNFVLPIDVKQGEIFPSRLLPAHRTTDIHTCKRARSTRRRRKAARRL